MKLKGKKMTDKNETKKLNPWDEIEKKPKKITRKAVLQRSVLMLIFVVIAFLIARGQGFRLNLPLKTNARHLSDGFFVIGMFVTGVGLLTWVSTTGFFDIFNYAFKSLLVLFTPFVKPENFPKFYDYKTMKAENRKKTEYSLLFMGLGLIIMAVLFLFVHYA